MNLGEVGRNGGRKELNFPENHLTECKYFLKRTDYVILCIQKGGELEICKSPPVFSSNINNNIDCRSHLILSTIRLCYKAISGFFLKKI